MNLDYPTYFDELPDQPISCYNCSEDCPGAYLIARGVTDEH